MENTRYHTKVSFAIEELAKSSRSSPSLVKEAIVYKINEIHWSFNPIGPLDLSKSRSTPIHVHMKRRHDSHSDCSTSPINTSDDSGALRHKKRARTSFTYEQTTVLEQYYATRKYLAIEDRPVLSKRLKISQAQIKWWFQNRRMKEKRQIQRGSREEDSDSELSCFVTKGKPCPRNITSAFNVSQSTENDSLSNFYADYSQTQSALYGPPSFSGMKLPVKIACST